jgi:hypothetical protein
MKIDVDELLKLKPALIEAGFPSDLKLFIDSVSSTRRLELIIDLGYDYIKGDSGIVVVQEGETENFRGWPVLYNTRDTVLKGLKVLTEQGLYVYTHNYYNIRLTEKTFDFMGENTWLPLTYCSPKVSYHDLKGLSIVYHLGYKEMCESVDQDILSKHMFGEERKKLVEYLPFMRKDYDKALKRLTPELEKEDIEDYEEYSEFTLEEQEG